MSRSDYDTPPCTEPVGEGQPPRTVDPGRGDVGTWITRMIMELMEGHAATECGCSQGSRCARTAVPGKQRREHAKEHRCSLYHEV